MTDAPPARRRTLDTYFDDLSVGDGFITPRRTVTETDLVNFSGLSGDFSSLHTDQVFAGETQFGGRIAHGALTLALATGLEYALMGAGQDKVLAFYGYDRVRFTRPVFPGDTIHVEGTVTALESKDDRRGVVTWREEVKNQRGETVAAFDKRVLNRRREV